MASGVLDQSRHQLVKNLSVAALRHRGVKLVDQVDQCLVLGVDFVHVKLLIVFQPKQSHIGTSHARRAASCPKYTR
jgi:hypothetical protein